jgi:leader peptidase (prepilin peptidase)/N-methyltransferase
VRISARYPLVEAGTALLCALVVVAKGADEDALLGLTLVLLLVPITLIDLDHRIIPNKLVLVGAVAAPAIMLLVAPDDLAEHVIAAGAAGGFFLLAALAYPRGMGMGDVKLAAVLGLFLGRAVGPAVFIALLSGTLVGVAVIARKAAEGRKTAVPFGPFLALGAICALFAGDALVHAYLSTLA